MLGKVRSFLMLRDPLIIQFDSAVKDFRTLSLH